jgi:hypothetical protein
MRAHRFQTRVGSGNGLSLDGGGSICMTGGFSDVLGS